MWIPFLTPAVNLVAETLGWKGSEHAHEKKTKARGNTAAKKVIHKRGLRIMCAPPCPIQSPYQSPIAADWNPSKPYTREFQLVLSDKGIETLMKELETQRVLKLYDASNNPPPHGTLTWPPTEKEDSTQQRPGAIIDEDTAIKEEELIEWVPQDLLEVL